MRAHNISTNVSCLRSSDTGTNVPEPLQTLWTDIAHICDERGWSQWAGIELCGHELNGRTGHVILLATYGPTPSDGDNSMWQYQERQMEKMDPTEQELDPRWQYIHDLGALITKYKEENVDVILVGDTNLNQHKTSPECDWWKNTMERNKLINWMQYKWPTQTATLNTWTNGVSSSWVDHIWMPYQLVRASARWCAHKSRGRTNRRSARARPFHHSC